MRDRTGIVASMVDAKDKNPHAVALGRRGGKKGGPARAAKLTKEERSDAARAAADARWKVPIAMHSGTLELGGLEIPCYVLDDERRVLSQRGMLAAMKMSGGGQGTTDLGNDRLVRFTRGRSISQFVDEKLEAAIASPFRFRMPAEHQVLNDGTALGYEAVILADLCEAILKARDAEALHPQQVNIAKQAEILARGFARVGIVALIDEATGFQYARARRALAEILEEFIAKELARWAKTFDDDYYRHLFRLRGGDPEDIRKRPGYFGHLTNDIVYSRLAPGVLEELRKKNVKPDGGRRAKQHQWLTREVGHPKLREHLASVIALMKVSSNYDTFIGFLDRAAPRFGDTLQMFPPDPG